MKISNVRKLIAAVVGLVAVIVGPAVIGVAPGDELWGMKEQLIQAVIAAGTAYGVWRLPNDGG